MGTNCSNILKEETPHQHDVQRQPGSVSSPKMLKKLHRLHHQSANMSHVSGQEKSVSAGKYRQTRTTRLDRAENPGQLLAYSQGEEYFKDRDELLRRGREVGFAYKKTSEASQEERKANEIVKIIRHNDKYTTYAVTSTVPKKRRRQKSLYDGQGHNRFPGDHFLTNVKLIGKTKLFEIAEMMPKGAHLHIHFNACLPPNVLMDIAAKMDYMYIWSNRPLTSKENLDLSGIQFSIKHDTDFKNKSDNGTLVEKSLFDVDYPFAEQETFVMQYKEFISCWNEQTKNWKKDPKMKRFSYMTSQEWLISKLVFNDREAHDPYQTAEGAWEKFNKRTRMMKGLFNYDSAFRDYTWQLLEQFERENLQYAEIRPNFMPNNQIMSDQGVHWDPKRGNEKTMEVIIEQCKKFMEKKPKSFLGIKVIYCTPRSFSNQQVKERLDECLEFKRRPEFRDYIAGFDLVGEESKGKPLKDFIPEFLEFKKNCREGTNLKGDKGLEVVDIPFLFHCGETLEIGGDTDANLIDALLLDSKRIGHGFALAKKPYLISEFKKRNICLEICPISNEILGLTPRVNGHAMYELLANNVHCTVNSDNGTLFRSTISHDFYQVMVGSDEMDLHGWRQLIEWSIEHASMSEDERAKLYRTWKQRWDVFIKWINDTYGNVQRIDGAEVLAEQLDSDYENDGMIRTMWAIQDQRPGVSEHQV